jgi:hypothetical protein
MTVQTGLSTGSSGAASTCVIACEPPRSASTSEVEETTWESASQWQRRAEDSKHVLKQTLTLACSPAGDFIVPVYDQQ